jgi:DNA-binding NtrC family response regulator
VKAQENVQLVEIRTLPEGCVTLEDAERAMIAAAIKDSHCTKLAAAARLGMGKTTLYRKLKQYGLHTTSESFMLKKKIEQLQAEIARLEKLLPEEMGGK